ncbi:hypothetical protein SD77_0861 [Bacillus badius]|uniref:BMC domain-containing protein n=1 Tax=Bacillus badius TaxID=1455 RepID=A0ABR5ASZ7_BACBA|nr:hypothetical protein SD78_2625 [Bacillus badius]KIL77882.1 hypothetical protein SD77_0861 [Bacillus badius]
MFLFYGEVKLAASAEKAIEMVSTASEAVISALSVTRVDSY